jgi:hypothetical protein
MTEIRYPARRKDFLHCIRSLADLPYQQKVWVRGEKHPGVEYDEFRHAVHFLFDDTDLSTDPHSDIGWFLRNANEADHVAAVVAALEVIFNKYGTEMSDAEYIALPEWQQVLHTAALALAATGE